MQMLQRIQPRANTFRSHSTRIFYMYQRQFGTVKILMHRLVYPRVKCNR